MKYSALLTLFFILFISSDIYAKCVKHIVKPGETFSKIAEQYSPLTSKHASYVQRAATSNKYPLINEEITFFVPDKKWDIDCEMVIQQRMECKGLEPTYEPKLIVAGIRSATRQLGLNEVQSFNLCIQAAVTAEQESMYRFAIGSAGEVGMFQFKLDTVRLTYRWYKSNLYDDSDEALVKKLISTTSAAYIYALHFQELKRRYGDIRLAWKHYNGGSSAEEYSERAMRRYKEIKRIEICK